ncbi:hypothetical protein, partial [Pseudomonas sp. GD04042]|uniref:hypothetical protein n=2 Tax=unclassified Pseudomonas TaxID=196821 RepID=UPI003260A2C1
AVLPCRFHPSARNSAETTSRLVTVALVQIQMLSDVLDQLQGLATVYNSKHEVAFAAGETLGTTLGGGLHCCIRAVNLGCKQ